MTKMQTINQKSSMLQTSRTGHTLQQHKKIVVTMYIGKRKREDNRSRVKLTLPCSFASIHQDSPPPNLTCTKQIMQERDVTTLARFIAYREKAEIWRERKG